MGSIESRHTRLGPLIKGLKKLIESQVAHPQARPNSIIKLANL